MLLPATDNEAMTHVRGAGKGYSLTCVDCFDLASTDFYKRVSLLIVKIRREETIGPCPCPRWGHPWRLNTFITKIIIIVKIVERFVYSLIHI